MKPEIVGQLALPRALRWQLRGEPGPNGTYTIVRANRQLPCRHGHVRIKIKEPGKFSRRCAVCGKMWWYGLEVGSSQRGVLVMRWLDDEELVEWIAEEMKDKES